MTHLRLNLHAPNTFSVAILGSEDVLGSVEFVLDQARLKPLGYRFTPTHEQPGPLYPTIPEALRERFGQVHLTLEAIPESSG